MTTIIDYQNLAHRFDARLTALLHDAAACIASKKEWSEKRNAILSEFYKSNDNIFSSVFKFRVENFHSELLRRILDPNTPETGDRCFLDAFMKVLEKTNSKITEHQFSASVQVEREKKGIDILIYDETHAVIIENKINNAIDQPNQLARYYQAVEDMQKKIIAVVYIPKFEDAAPPLNDYNVEYKKYIPEIEKKLVVLPAINRRNDGKKEGNEDIAHVFIDHCINQTDKTSPKNYIVSQYAKLLKTIEGESKMTESIDREFILEFYKDKKSIETIENMADVWYGREAPLNSILRAPLSKKLKSDLGFSEDDGDKYALYKDINDKLRIAFCSYPPDDLLHLGFFYENSAIKTKEKLTRIEKTLNDVLPEMYFAVDTWGKEHKGWLTKKFRIGEYKAPIAEIEAYFIDRCKSLIAAAKELAL